MGIEHWCVRVTIVWRCQLIESDILPIVISFEMTLPFQLLKLDFIARVHRWNNTQKTISSHFSQLLGSAKISTEMKVIWMNKKKERNKFNLSQSHFHFQIVDGAYAKRNKEWEWKVASTRKTSSSLLLSIISFFLCLFWMMINNHS